MPRANVDHKGATRKPRKWRAMLLLAGLGAFLGLAGPGYGQTFSRGRPQTSVRPSASLTEAIELQRQGDFDQAQQVLDQLARRQSSLSPAERQELARVREYNLSALDSRRQARVFLSQAADAVRAGQSARALENLRKVAPHEQYLTLAERRTVQELRKAAGQGTTPTPAPTAPPTVSKPASSLPAGHSALARTKLQQARRLMAEGNFAGAGQLAREAGATAQDWRPGEDNPAQLLADLDRFRRDPKMLLQSSRQALQLGELERAARLADAAEKAAGPLTFPRWGDTPAKVRKDIQAAQNTTTTTTTTTVAVEVTSEKPKSTPFQSVKNFITGKKPEKKEQTPDETFAVVPTPPTPKTESQGKPAVADPAIAADTEAVRQLVRQGRKALQENRLDTANRCVDEARRRSKAMLDWWEDNPEKLAADIRRVHAQNLARRNAPPQPAPVTVASTPKPTPVAPPTATPTPVADKPPVATPVKEEGPKTRAEGLALLRQGRAALKRGNLDEASRIAQLVRISVPASEFGLFDDTPDKLQNDLNKERRKRDRAESARLLKEARRLYAQGDLDKATSLAFEAEKLHGPYEVWELGDRPSKLLADIQTARERNRPTLPAPAQQSTSVVASQTKPTEQQGTPTVPPAPTPTPVASKSPVAPTPAAADKQQARQLLVQAHRLQQEGKLLEALEKTNQAKAMKVAWTTEETSPDQMRQQLAARAKQRLDNLTQKAIDLAAYGLGDPLQNCTLAEKYLLEGRTLAQTFGLDATAVNQHLVLVAQLKERHQALARQPQPQQQQGQPVVQASGGNPPAPVVLPTPKETPGKAVASDPGMQRGLELLEKSRLELRKGQLQLARKLAEEAYAGPYNVKAQAQIRLREIDIEEYNQRKLEARRAFDAGRAAFARRDYFHAREILANLNPTDLDERQRAQLTELLSSPELSRSAQPAVAKTGGAEEKSNVKLVSGQQAGKASVSDEGDLDPASRTAALLSIQFQELRQQSLKIQQEAAERFKSGETDTAIELLQDYLVKLPESQLDPDRLNMLRRPIESRLQKYKLLKAQAEFEHANGQVAAKTAQKHREKSLNEANKQKHIKELMARYNSYFKEGKFKEAEMYAMMVKELDPDNPVATAAAQIARTQRRRIEHKKNKDAREELFWNGMEDAEKEGPFVSVDNPVSFNKERWSTVRGRKPSQLDFSPRKSPREQEIERKMQTPITLSFQDTPLSEVIETIRAEKGINVVADVHALAQENVSLDRPVTVKLENISLKSALNIVLRQVQLTWVIRDDALQVTTETHARGKLTQRTYQVADLITPVMEAQPNISNDLNRALESASPQNVSGRPSNPGMNGGVMGGVPTGTTSTGMPTNGGNPTSQFAAQQPSNGQWSVQPRVTTLKDTLISLITNTIAPGTWRDSGGPGTIDYFPLGGTLIVNQTQDIQEQVADLLAALRRLQDQEIAVEVRFISIAEGFYERLGMDLNFNIKTDRQTARFEPQLTTNNFKPVPFINDFSPSRFLAGITPAGTFTSDLDIPINPTSFAMAIPPFGGFPNSTGNNGGLSLGLAFLSDIQVFLFMEAAQGDQRTNVMQAPRLTMYNGSVASLSVTAQQFFVVNVQPINNNGQLYFLPFNTGFPLGVQLTIQAVISGDRRFVRLNLAPSLTNLASAVVPLFPIVTFIQPVFEGVGAVGQPTTFVQFLQQPVIQTISAQTTVVVPDGGTVLLGGLKRLSEGRNEFGPPVLSKIPYVNRLFKNVGYGREAESLLIMVTPRIIINEEEEIAQTGVIVNPQLTQTEP